jgi:hypothetical protein
MRRIGLGVVFLLAMVAASSAQDVKLDKERFSPERFAALQAQGELVLQSSPPLAARRSGIGPT